MGHFFIQTQNIRGSEVFSVLPKDTQWLWIKSLTLILKGDLFTIGLKPPELRDDYK